MSLNEFIEYDKELNESYGFDFDIDKIYSEGKIKSFMKDIQAFDELKVELIRKVGGNYIDEWLIYFDKIQQIPEYQKYVKVMTKMIFKRKDLTRWLSRHMSKNIVKLDSTDINKSLAVDIKAAFNNLYLQINKIEDFANYRATSGGYYIVTQEPNNNEEDFYNALFRHIGFILPKTTWIY